jgi:hypothetical protein
MSLIRDRVKLEKKDGIAYVTLSRADKYKGW